MRKISLAVAVAIGLAGGATASMANAQAVVTGSSGAIVNPAPVALFDALTNTWSINYGENPVLTNPYSASVMFNTDSAFSANFTASSSTGGAYFTNALLTGTGLGAGLTFSGVNPTGVNAMTTPAFVSLYGVPLAAGGSYILSFTLDNASTFTGNSTLTPSAVPEPATWGMMLLGFGAMGIAIRRRSKPVFAQIA